MDALILGGTRYMGTHLARKLIADGHDVTIATRGNVVDSFGESVRRIIIDRNDAESLYNAFKGKHYDVTIDNLAYSSNDVKILLNALSTEKYIMTSTASVYAQNFHMNMKEAEIDSLKTTLKWCNNSDYEYDEVKRQAEAALFQAYLNQIACAVRFSFIFGKDDYTKRLFYYVESIFEERAMYIDNISERLSFIESTEAGQFLTHVATTPVIGAINASSIGTISLEEIIVYAEKRIGKKAILCERGEAAPLNGCPGFSLDTSLAEQSGFRFMDINEWVYPLIDFWMSELKG